MTRTLLADYTNRYGLDPWSASSQVSRDEAARYCERLARSHYENFTVGSFLLPKAKRRHIYNVYAFCRWADDLGDESGSPEEATRLLRWWGEELEGCYQGRATHPVFVALSETIREFRIPIEPFQHLIHAFTLDQTKTRYGTFEDLCAYARYSANPVGRIYLLLFKSGSEENFRLSDATCTALQLTNFWQDVTRDWDKGRVYLPQVELREAGVTEADLAARRFTPAFGGMMRGLVGRTRTLFHRGLPLLDRVPASVRLDIELFTRGGVAILDKIAAQGYDVLSRRPAIGKLGKLSLLLAHIVGRAAGVSRPISANRP